MALIPYRDYIRNGSNFTNFNNWVVEGDVIIDDGQIIMQPGGKILQDLDVNSIPSRVAVSIFGKLAGYEEQGGVKAFVRLITDNDTRWMPIITRDNSLDNYEYRNEMEFAATDRVAKRWRVEVLAVERIDISMITAFLYSDTDFLDLEDRATDVEEKYTSLVTDLDGLTYTVGVNKSTADGRFMNIETQVSIVAGELNSKVSESDLDGNYVASLINQTATSIKIQANKIELNGAVIANGSITGTSSISIATDARVGNNLYLGEYNTGTKSVVFNNAARINSVGSTGIQVSAESFTVNNGNVFLGGGSYYVSITGGNISLSPNANNSGYVKSFTDGLEITRNSGNSSQLSVKLYGSYIGNLQLIDI